MTPGPTKIRLETAVRPSLSTPGPGAGGLFDCRHREAARRYGSSLRMRSSRARKLSL